MQTFSLRRALRTLFSTPFVTVVAMASLALGIGANAVIFSLFEQFLRRPLPVQEPECLVNMAAPPSKPGSTSSNNAGGCDEVFSYLVTVLKGQSGQPSASRSAVRFRTSLATVQIGLPMALGADAGRIRGMVM